MRVYYRLYCLWSQFITAWRWWRLYRRTGDEVSCKAAESHWSHIMRNWRYYLLLQDAP